MAGDADCGDFRMQESKAKEPENAESGISFRCEHKVKNDGNINLLLSSECGPLHPKGIPGGREVRSKEDESQSA